nr:AAA family ATPase [Olsenella phocaeensis]
MEQRGKYMSSKPNRLTPDGYLPRLTDARLDMLMGAFGCVEITGPKWCGKTWSALSRAASVTELDRGEQRQMAEVDPSLALLGDAPHLVDEWQEVPAVWDAARRFVDDSAAKTGRLLLTGSTQLEPARRGLDHVADGERAGEEGGVAPVGLHPVPGRPEHLRDGPDDARHVGGLELPLQVEAGGAALVDAPGRLRQPLAPPRHRAGVVAERRPEHLARLDHERGGADGPCMHVKTDVCRIEHGWDLP